ncbi:MAG: site-2 protease family protein [Chloroflexi bacterium]|nr:site-2 protease family protein [Chloroflexota bacterium]
MEPKSNLPSLHLQLNSAFAQAYGDIAKTALGIVGQDMAVESIRTPDKPAPEGLEVRGRLLRPSAEVFSRWLAEFNRRGFTPFLRQDEQTGSVGGQNVVLQVLAGVVPRSRSNPLINLLLFVVTVLSTLFVGVLYGVDVGLDPNAGILELMWQILTTPDLLVKGLPFAVTLLGILTAHEFGHYFAARYHKVAVTLPYFLPMPLGFGTLGAFIRLKEPVPDRRKLFDIGVAGPLAGLLLAVPLLFYGLSTSEVMVPQAVTGALLEGNSFLYYYAKLWTFGQALPNPVTGLDVMMNDITFAAWIGLLVTALNLLPLGQLDGGHTVFALFGQRARLFNWATLGGMLLLGIAGLEQVQARIGGLENVGWSGWFMWLVLINFLGGPFHPPALDDVTELDPRRRWLGYAVILIFVLTFVPVPLRAL